MIRAPQDGVAAGAVELLERSLAWTSGALTGVEPGLLDRPTPCERWRLRDLLTHLEDGLDAFTEAAAGHVAVAPAPLPDDPDDRCGRLRSKACTLLGAWSRARWSGAPTLVRVDGPAAPGRPAGSTAVGLDADVLVRAAALEITVHGWDVARATGVAGPGRHGGGHDSAAHDGGLPPALARDLLPAARLLVPRDGRAGRFAGPTPYDASDGPAAQLLAWLGR